MTLSRLRQVLFWLFMLCTMPLYWPILADPAYGWIGEWIITGITLLMAWVLFLALVHSLAHAFRRDQWHT